MQYAIIKLGGNQYKIKEGDVIETENLNLKPGEKVSFDNVLLVVSNGTPIIGTPKVEGAYVKAVVLGNDKGEKIRVSKFKAKVRYRRVTGKRQNITKVKIEEIVTKEKRTKAEKRSS